MLWMMLIWFYTEGEKAPETDDFKKIEMTWRAEREKSMKADDSWLNIVGLFWLKEGPNPFGSKYDLRISLPRHTTVENTGVFYFENGKVRYEMNRGQRALVDGEPRNKGNLALGEILAHNHLRMFLIERGGKTALRVRDLRARNFINFASLNFYRPKKKYLLEGVYDPYPEPEKIKITTVISTEIELIVPGIIHFELEGQSLELIPTLESTEDEEYMIMFQDKTSGSTTYSGGRFLYVPRPGEDGKVVLNFNRAVNPPCAYTVYATCPLPPAENWMDVAVEAGERTYLSHEE